jgi:large subunit ribosomal protein L25
VVYGKKIDPVSVTVDERDFTKAMEQAGKNPLFELKIKDGGNVTDRVALLKDRQVNPLDGELVHLDFMEIALDKPIEVPIPLHFTGKARGVEMGGTFRPTARYLNVSCLPADIPDFISIDIARLKIGDVIQVGEAPLPTGVTALDPENYPLATVLAPKKGAELEEEEEAEAAAAEGEEAAEGEGEAKPEGSEA